MKCFPLASGLNVDYQKSIIAGMGTNRLQLHRYAMLKCQTMNILFTCLRVKVDGNHRRTKFWKGMVEKIKKRLARWKGKFISLTGRVCLIKFVLSTMLMFLLSIFRLP